MRRARCSWRKSSLANMPEILSRNFWPGSREAKSNVPSAGDGARLYKEKVGPLQLGLEQVAAHYAISSIFSSFAEETSSSAIAFAASRTTSTPRAAEGSLLGAPISPAASPG